MNNRNVFLLTYKTIKIKIVILMSLFSFLAQANDIIDNNIVNLIQQRLGEEIIVEINYNKSNQLNAIENSQQNITDVILQDLNERKSSFNAKLIFSNNHTQIIKGFYKSFLMVPIAKRHIKFGEILQDQDISTTKIRIEAIPQGSATNVAEIVGMQTKKYISPGKMFKLADIVLPHVIKNGDPVNIVYSSGSIGLKTLGMSMSNGAVGDTIKVKNTSSGAIILGQIINKNTVKVGGDNE
jgi:flagella basal body P-ring formation protein FlgA